VQNARQKMKCFSSQQATGDSLLNLASASAGKLSFIKGDVKTSPRIVVLVGLPGSGKSTFSALVSDRCTPENDWVVVNQDTLGGRNACLKLARTALTSGKRVIIDRTNLDSTQRAHWLALSTEFSTPLSPIYPWLIEFSVPEQELLRRCKARIGHPTVNKSNAAKVLGFGRKDYRAPNMTAEGFSCYVRLTWEGDEKNDFVDFKNCLADHLSQSN
jgi:predicted kinase